MLEWAISMGGPAANFASLMRQLPQGYKVYHVHGSFGDVYLQIATISEYIQASIDAENKALVAVLIDSKYILLAENSLNGAAKILSINSAALNSLLTSVGVIGKFEGVPIRLLSTHYPMITEIILEGKLPYMSYLRFMVDSPCVGPIRSIESVQSLVDESMSILDTAGLPNGKTIILSADNNTQVELPLKVWELVVEEIQKLGLNPCINDSGTLSTTHGTLLSEFKLPKIKIPPHLVVTLAKVAGGYVVGNNGYATIQALFNDSRSGIHLINGFILNEGRIKDKFGNSILLDRFFHKLQFKDEHLGTQVEYVVDDRSMLAELPVLIKNTFSHLTLY